MEIPDGWLETRKVISPPGSLIRQQRHAHGTYSTADGTFPQRQHRTERRTLLFQISKWKLESQARAWSGGHGSPSVRAGPSHTVTHRPCPGPRFPDEELLWAQQPQLLGSGRLLCTPGRVQAGGLTWLGCEVDNQVQSSDPTRPVQNVSPPHPGHLPGRGPLIPHFSTQRPALGESPDAGAEEGVLLCFRSPCSCHSPDHVGTGLAFSSAGI